MTFIIFFSIIFIIYASINTYIYLRALQAFAGLHSLKIWFTAIFWFLAALYILARIMEKVFPSWFVEPMIWVGSFWLGAMIYFFLFIVVIDLLRLVNFFIPFFPSFITRNVQLTKQYIVAVVFIITVIIVVVGRLNAMFPQIVKFELQINKKAPLHKLNLVALSDVHLGTIVCNAHFTRIVEKINSLQPDVVLFVGDIVDEDVEPVIRQNLGETLNSIKSKYGLYGITGNHEYIGGVEKACKYLEANGVNMLRDTTVKIADSFYLVGREDVSIQRFNGKSRKSLKELVKNIDISLPIILLDHQPVALNEAVLNEIDIVLCGHTHYGQLWPFGFISEMVYELSWGFKKKENTNIYVSSGVGMWGPPIRTSSRPEIVNIELKFIQ